MSISGNDSGAIIILGNLFGAVTVGGALSGQVAVSGQAISGLAAGRDGILGNLIIGKLVAGGSIVSGGEIGDAGSSTYLKVSNSGGFVWPPPERSLWSPKVRSWPI